MTGDIVTVNARKYDGRLHRSWHGGLVSANGSLVTLLAKFSATHLHSDLGTIHAGTLSTEYFWLDRWYNVFRFREPDGSPKAIYANIATPAVFDGSTLDYIDLDIDVIQWPDGRVDVLDREEFEQNSAAFGYPSDVMESTMAALEEVLQLMAQGQFPFEK